MKKKGFTLIELLAVIVILAIIALIATPIVMDVIENSKKGAAARSAERYIDAVETAVGTERIDGVVTTDSTMIVGEYSVSYDSTKEAYVATKEQTGNTSITVYRWSSEDMSEGDTLESDAYTTDPSTLGKDYYLKHVLDENNKILESYTCVKYNTKESCVRGGQDYYGYAEDPTNYTGNLLVLKGLQDDGFTCVFRENSSYCSKDSVYLGSSSNGVGNAYIGEGNEYCDVGVNGYSICESW